MSSERIVALPTTPRLGHPLDRIARPLARACYLLLIWQERIGSRRRLVELDDRMLRDIGLTRAALRAECDKPFWRP